MSRRNHVATSAIFTMRCFEQKLAEADTDISCLQVYKSAWENFLFSTKVANGVMRYLNRTYLKTNPSKGLTVESLAYTVWKEHLFDHLNAKVADAAVRMLDLSRNGHRIDTEPISAVISTYIQLGFLEHQDDTDGDSGRFRVSLNTQYMQWLEITLTDYFRLLFRGLFRGLFRDRFTKHLKIAYCKELKTSTRKPAFSTTTNCTSVKSPSLAI